MNRRLNRRRTKEGASQQIARQRRKIPKKKRKRNECDYVIGRLKYQRDCLLALIAANSLFLFSVSL